MNYRTIITLYFEQTKIDCYCGSLEGLCRAISKASGEDVPIEEVAKFLNETPLVARRMHIQ